MVLEFLKMWKAGPELKYDDGVFLYLVAVICERARHRARDLENRKKGLSGQYLPHLSPEYAH